MKVVDQSRTARIAHTEMHRLLTPADYRRMPWKNGGGHTTEIAAEPSGAGMASFVWRVSVADIAQDGPFSAFPGIDRTLVLLSGHGMRLATAGDTMDLHTPYEPVAFAGEAPIECALTRGPTRDFNLMVRRDAASGNVVVVRDSGEALAPARAYVCYAAEGVCECLFAGHPPVVLAPQHALVVALEPSVSATGLHVHPRSAAAVALVAVIGAPQHGRAQ
jgi:environmental stress-induced protein Ves